MYVIMRHDDYLQLDHKFERAIENVRIFRDGNLAHRIAKKLKGEVLLINRLVREKVWVLDKNCKFQFERALNRATEIVDTNCLDNRSTLDVPRQPVINGEQSDGW